MKKIFIQGFLIVVMFITTLIVLRQIDWMSVFKVKENKEATEQKLGKLFWDFFKKTEKENKNPEMKSAIDSIMTRICDSNGFQRSEIQVFILDKDDVNAFALPGGYMVIFDGLIRSAGSQEELIGVICHELAHIKQGHVMKKLINELGLSVLVSMTTGSGSPQLIIETAKMLSSTAFDRKLEKEADLVAVDYMIKANINPEPFADFLYKLSTNEDEFTRKLSWISTHPESRERAAYILEYCKGKSITSQPVLTDAVWEMIRQ